MSITSTKPTNRERALRRASEQLGIARRSIDRALRAAASAGWANEILFRDPLDEVTKLEGMVDRAADAASGAPHAPDCDRRSQTLRCSRSGTNCCACDPCNVCVGRA